MIQISNLNKSYGEHHVLKGIDLDIKDGETISIIGPSGSGKSTFLRCLNLLEKPEEGDVTIGEHHYDATHIDKKNFRDFSRITAMVFQNYGLFSNKNVLENITLPLTVVKKENSQTAKNTALKLLEKVGLLDKQKSYPNELSGGQQQRVGIARALALNPELILFDEPTSALDPELVGEVLSLIKKVASEKITTIIVTHEIAFAREISDRIVFMDNGVVVEEGSPEEVIDHPQNSRTKQFLQRFTRNDY
ncbi:amino acid ABC transporter ATP-binding protein [uncultured Catenibacterium sp.]|uniref:amino acid ABC transporter ATP-binding protein n=1 Tax=uncultured Catenibacterium sp. TaxID=286142 RepID=UPI0025D43172|nr:amino acid ABC transporter ATP-binding protein [uncultured Catenibacterium sp.]